ncbi:nicotinate-nucleotide--dimethylbenzimidazole phosphoribosyltransferase [Desulfotalea psychrophila]|uniref:Nicotinate-nucleotide--dimethylbenzimidazole phosphoribosyltransferase n=1 Tax=Desulfotalea psychrophila (strain LSv54 / DSM 12343) TaxID=177439 RepID=COBT_DESPS|nr:nicotinate-nucleotide--dimethylbenzimidazole phosphoribosyltransferase [Desulfotalea psychrophila]Q6ALU4.1 RecName: Full=Nicotinate-nucleotide--dimethylbenzimidazole phosphoribosyltransferase; Short=NN:DBI PRT; AltName: Full=N(1)-alpha-phosphoribosyltransferase [Desulfotalea psychrophila LSv54]CAG36681.1 related to nicotinate-nucleotide--dimethylbenzimidazole phosphoribosyltransferase (CobT) [Desulfotalea psychrophila LSv54]
MSLLDRTLLEIFPQDSDSRDAAKARLDNLVMPHWALGDLMDLAIDLAGMQRTIKPLVDKRAIVTMAGDHGVAAEGVSKFPAEVTVQMVHAIIGGSAGVNALARSAGADVFVVDMGVNADLRDLVEQKKLINKKVGLGTGNIAKGPAMSRAMAVRAVEGGIDVAFALSTKYNIIGTGEMGIGNTTPSAAIAAVCTGKTVEEITGRGSGLNDAELQTKIDIIKKSIEINKPNSKDGLDILAKVGGFEIGGIAGLIIGCAAKKIPVVVDGYISTAGALIAAKIEPFVRDYLIFAHRSVEPGHVHMQEFLGCKRPLLDLNFRLGEGTGAAMAMNLVDGAKAILTDMSTFDEIAVTAPEK